MTSFFYDLPGQAVRRNAVYRKLIEYTRDRFDSEGQWLGEFGENTPVPGLRERLWFCAPFLAADDRKLWGLADTIIQHSEYSFCTFAPLSALLLLLLRFHDRLAPASVRNLENYLNRVLDQFAGEHTRQTYLRRTAIHRPGLDLESEYSSVTEGIKFQAVNGWVPPAPRLEVTGLPPLPFG